MITWMQRHKKYLIVTIWISTIAFVGAGFVGWGQYSYGDKAGAVAKVGEIEITMGDLQKSYSRLYAQYNEVFQGNFDEEKAKSFGLQQQALKQLTDQALVLNLAEEYELQVTDQEVYESIKKQEYFLKDGVFDKTIYENILSRNNLTKKEYEADLRKELLIKKVLVLLQVKENPNEAQILNTVFNIADKINYKVLSENDINIDTSDAKLKPFWETMQQNFMTEVSYDLKYIKHPVVQAEVDEAAISKHYEENKIHFKDAEGKIKPLADAKEDVLKALNAKATKKAALRAFIDYKKDKLEGLEPQTITLSESNNPFSLEVYEKVTALTKASPYVKPLLVGETYYTFELVQTNPSKPKTYEVAKAEVLPLFVQEEKKKKLIELAEASLATFNGKMTDFITVADANTLTELSVTDANDFLTQLFNQKSKRGYITLNSQKVVLYNIMEQKLLKKSNNNLDNSLVRLKGTIFNEGLMKNLQEKYQTEIYIQGL